jgi:micrococcal nuclease
MKRYFPLFFFVFLTIVIAGFFTTLYGGITAQLYRIPPSNPPNVLIHPLGIASTTLYEVVKVVDGDTIDLRMEGEVIRVRLIGINTPETVDPRKPVECFGKEASMRMKVFLSGGRVSLQYDSSQGMEDKYARRLAYVYLPDGTFINELMIAEGYAYEYTYRTPYQYQRTFKESERLARLNSLGLWSPHVCQ